MLVVLLRDGLMVLVLLQGRLLVFSGYRFAFLLPVFGSSPAAHFWEVLFRFGIPVLINAFATVPARRLLTHNAIIVSPTPVVRRLRPFGPLIASLPPG
jgi:hypothetical protein